MNSKYHNTFSTYRIPLILRGLFLVLAILIYSSFSAKASTQQEITVQPLQITNVTVSSEPLAGQVVTLEIEIMSSNDEPDVKFTVDTREHLGNKIQLISGNSLWQGSLIANQPKTFEITVQVIEEGSWPVEFAVISYLPENNGWIDVETIQLESSSESGRLIRGSDYTYSQETIPGYTPHFLLGEELSGVNSPNFIPPPPTPSVLVAGEIKYDARETEDRSTYDVLDQPLGRVVMKLYDRQPGGDVLVAETKADADGNYAFPPIPNRTDIDLFMVIWATDDDGISSDARVNVVGANGNTYFYPPVGFPPVNVGQNLPDGTVTFNYTIPRGANDESQPFYIFDQTANRAFNWVESETGWGNQRLLTIHWPQPCVIEYGEPGGCFRGDLPNYGQGEGEIYLEADPGKEPDLIIHEYGHFVLSRFVGDQRVRWIRKFRHENGHN